MFSIFRGLSLYNSNLNIGAKLSPYTSEQPYATYCYIFLHTHTVGIKELIEQFKTGSPHYNIAIILVKNINDMNSYPCC